MIRPLHAALLVLLFPTLLMALLSGSPVALQATSTFQSHAPIIIIGNAAFTQPNGVLGGSGDPSDPYILEGWKINASLGNGITIVNTTRSFVIQGVNVFQGIRGIYLHNIINGIVRASTISDSIDGILVTNSSNILISNNVVSDTSFSFGGKGGIRLEYCSGASVVGNVVSTVPRLKYGVDQKPGILLSSSPGAIVSDNDVWYSSSAISLKDSARALVRGNNASYNEVGISLSSSPFANVTGNYVAHNLSGIGLGSSSNSSIAKNVVLWNVGSGVAVFSENATALENTISFNGRGISCCHKTATIKGNTFTQDGLVLAASPGVPYVSLSITPDNLVNGKPLYFYSACSNLDINGVPVGQLILLNCKNIRISNLEIYYTVVGIQLANVNDTLITANSVNSNTQVGIKLLGSSNVTVVGNNLSNNGNNGGLNTYSDSAGLVLAPFDPTSSLVFAHHNNLFYNGAFDENNRGVWDNGYPSGGNFWSVYTGRDNCSGPGQNICPSPDGIGDTRMQNYPAITDQYPLMSPYIPTPDASPPTWHPNTRLEVTDITHTSATLYWMKSADNVAVVNYQIYQGSTLIETLSAGTLRGFGHTYAVGNLTAGTTYTFRVVAVDEVGNVSAEGLSAAITTMAQIPPGVGSWLLQYWDLLGLGIGGAIATSLVLLKVRAEKRKSLGLPVESQRPRLASWPSSSAR